MSVRPAKTQISLGIRPIWAESSLSTWRKLGSLVTHWAHSLGGSESLLAYTHFVGFVMRWLECGSLSAASSTSSIYCVSEQQRLWRDCTDSQARLSLHCSHIFISNIKYMYPFHTSCLKLCSIEPFFSYNSSSFVLEYLGQDMQKCVMPYASVQSDQHLCCSLLR